MKSITVEIEGVGLDVIYEYSYDPGVHTYSNGDPGYPPSEELEIAEIKVGGEDIYPLLDAGILNRLEEQILEIEREELYF